MRLDAGDSPHRTTTAATNAVAALLCAAALVLCGSCKDGSGDPLDAWSNLWKPKPSPSEGPKPSESDEGLHRPFGMGPVKPIEPEPAPPSGPSEKKLTPAEMSYPKPLPKVRVNVAQLPGEEPTTRPKPTSRPVRPLRKRLPTLKVLFIGNAYSTEHDMPAMVQVLAKAARENVRLHVATVAPGGSTLSAHWYETSARKAIRTGGWDWVVLQEQSTRPLNQRNLMHRFARELDKEVRNFGAKTMFYLTWSRKNKPRTQREITSAYVAIAKELKSDLAPVGIAWQMCGQQRPTLSLHQKDMSHPTVDGAYLTACVFYSCLFGRTPQGLPATLVQVTPKGDRKILAEINPTRALLLQSIAWDAVRSGRRMLKAP